MYVLFKFIENYIEQTKYVMTDNVILNGTDTVSGMGSAHHTSRLADMLTIALMIRCSSALSSSSPSLERVSIPKQSRHGGQSTIYTPHYIVHLIRHHAILAQK